MALQFKAQKNLFEAFSSDITPPSFDEIWDLDIAFFEPPNTNRGGWSGVVQYELNKEIPVFIKRQENHVYRSLEHFFKNRPTFEREYKNIMHLNQIGIPTYEMLYFANQNVDHGFKTILITKSLVGYNALNDAKLDLAHLAKNNKKKLIEALASVLRQMHDCGIQHNCLYQKHIFAKLIDNTWDIRLIDLEKSKKVWFKKKAVLRDLNTLYRTSQNISRATMLRFFLEYRQIKKLSKKEKWLIKSIVMKT